MNAFTDGWPPSGTKMTLAEFQAYQERARLEQHRHAEKIMEERDVDKLIASFWGDDVLAFVESYAPRLKKLGIYEATLLQAYVTRDSNHLNWPMSSIRSLFNAANHRKLLKAGDPLPDGDSFTVYRGVSGSGRYRRVRSYSWTLDRATAEWFAHRYLQFGAKHPGVYRAVIRREDVLAYYNGSNEEEILCYPQRYRQVPLLGLHKSPEFLAKRKDLQYA
jgi:hypothetical protein